MPVFTGYPLVVSGYIVINILHHIKSIDFMYNLCMRIRLDENWIDIGEKYQEPKSKVHKCLFCNVLLRPEYYNFNYYLCGKHLDAIEQKIAENDILIEQQYAVQQMS